MRLTLRRLCPEFMAVVAATTWPISAESLCELRELLRGPLNWAHFLDVVRRQRVPGLVHASLRELPAGCVPAPVLQEMEAESWKSARRNLIAVAGMCRLTAELHRAGIEVAVLKGAPLGVLIYGDPGIRHSKDLDLLVRPEQVMAAESIVTSLGYRRTTPPQTWTTKEVEEFRAVRSHFEYVHPASKSQVEMHWRISENPLFGVQFPLPETWQTVKVGGGFSVRTLSRPDLLEYLCTHGASHAWSRLKWLADVAAMVRSDEAAAGLLLERAAAHGTSRAAAQALSLCWRLYGVRTPGAQDPGVWVGLLTRLAMDAMTTGCGAGELAEDRLQNAKVHGSHFLLSFRPRYLAMELRREVLLPPAWSEVKPTRGRRLLHGVRGVWLGLHRS